MGELSEPKAEAVRNGAGSECARRWRPGDVSVAVAAQQGVRRTRGATWRACRIRHLGVCVRVDPIDHRPDHDRQPEAEKGATYGSESDGIAEAKSAQATRLAEARLPQLPIEFHVKSISTAQAALLGERITAQRTR